MSDWDLVPFSIAFAEKSSPSRKIQRSAYLSAGKFPVIDQGQDLIGGYTNRADAIYEGSLPVIIFGDHTRTFKYVDFLFAAGADGTKILSPGSELGFDCKFLYYYLSSLQIPSAGYSRHFKFLKDLSIPRPPLSEQRRIVELLDKARALQVKRRQALQSMGELAQSIFFEMFGDPISNSNKYSQRSLLELVDPTRPITYGILKPGPDQNVGVAYVRVVDMIDGEISLSNMRKTSKIISSEYRRSLLSAGDLLISIRGHVGRLAIVPDELDGANITQDTARLAVKDAEPIFVRELLRHSSSKQWMARRTKGAAVQGINLADLKIMPVIVPPQEEQKRFSEMVANIDETLARLRFQSIDFQALFSSLEQRAFRGQL